MTGSPDLQEPPTISLLSLADRFIEDHKRMPNRAFAFVLGAGASRSSGIKGASQMVEDWIRSLHREATGEADGDSKVWANTKTLGIKHYDPADPAACYSELYHKMYARDPDRGYAYLEEQMQDSEPSYGYSVLARIMEITQHRVVVTTNFDNLVADALSIFCKTYPLVCGHESLAGFISARIRRPLVVKVHRDLLLAPKSAPKDLNNLPDGFRAALTKLFGHYTPIVIGYGGNDGSLMGFLRQLPPASVPGGVYWCYWKGGGLPSSEIQHFVAAQNGCLVPIPGFDETMMLLSEELGFEVPDQFVRDRAELRAKRIGEQVLALKEKLDADRRRLPIIVAATDDRIGAAAMQLSPVSEQQQKMTSSASEADALAQALKKTMRRTSGALRWWQWEEKAKAAIDDDERERIYQKAISALPDAHELLCNYAIFLKTVREDYEKAEEYFLRALAADPLDADYLGNYALFLTEIGKDYGKAEDHYVRALAADPTHVNNLGNYALFLTDIREDYNKAEENYFRALSAEPVDARHIGNYALFLERIRKDYNKAEDNYLRAIATDPTNANYLGNYAVFLEDVRKDYNKAEENYLRALSADPGHANNLGNYARLLLTIGRTDEGLVMLDRALAVPESDLLQPLTIELRMYEVCHRLPDSWLVALSMLKNLLLTDKIITGDWDFSGVLEAAKRRGHPAGEWLDPLATVCVGTSDVSVLDGWDAWKRA